MSTINKGWIIRRPDGMYLKHPRGEWTTDINFAWGWHYKAEAKNQASDECEVRRREFFKGFLQQIKP